jgi:hypothetical protein
MDLDLFLTVAHDIFLNAFKALYKESPGDGIIEDALTDPDKAHNCQCLINNLYSRTQNAALLDIKGVDVISRRHHAIGVIVGVLFAEGQRLWLARNGPEAAARNNGGGDRDNHSVGASASSSHKKGKKKAKKPKSYYTAVDGVEPYPDESGPVSSAALDGIIDRIKYLEKKLNKPTQFGDPLAVQNNIKLMYAHDNVRADDAGAGGGSPNSRKGKHRPKRGNRGNVERTASERVGDADDGPRPEDNTNDGPEQHKEAADTGPRQKRPSSAPSSRPRSAGPGAFNRLFQQARRESQPSDPTPPPAAGVISKPSQLPPPEPGVEYVYDLNGRRIAVTEEYKRKKEREDYEARMKAGNVNNAEDLEKHTKPTPKNVYQPPQPTVAVQPFKRSVDDWVAKSRKELEEKRQQHEYEQYYSKVGVHPGQTGPQVRSYGAYQLLEPGDMLISVEHCHSCQSHGITLRHDAAGYSQCADNMLQHCVETVMDLNLCVRVGIAKIKAVITNNVVPGSSAGTVPGSASGACSECRIGALEVQVAYKDAIGRVHVDVLHSKLSSQNWPSKTVVAKRLTMFTSKHFIPTFEFSGSDEFVNSSPANVGGGCGVNGYYAVGSGPFSALDIGSGGWSFPSHIVSDLSHDSGDWAAMGVCLLYDSRSKGPSRPKAPSAGNALNAARGVSCAAVPPVGAASSAVRPKSASAGTRPTASASASQSSKTSEATSGGNSSVRPAEPSASAASKPANPSVPAKKVSKKSPPSEESSPVGGVTAAVSANSESSAKTKSENAVAPATASESKPAAKTQSQRQKPKTDDASDPKTGKSAASSSESKESKTSAEGAAAGPNPSPKQPVKPQNPRSAKPVKYVDEPAQPSVLPVDTQSYPQLLESLKQQDPQVNSSEEHIKRVLFQLHSHMGGDYWNCCFDWDLQSSISHWGNIVLDHTASEGGVGAVTLRELNLPDAGVINALANTSLHQLRTLKVLNLCHNSISGVLPPEIGHLQLLTHLQLNNNQLEGCLPVEYSRLLCLEVLDVSHNNLSGRVPRQYSQLSRLRTMKLHKNPGIQGPLPPSLESLTSCLQQFSCDLCPYTTNTPDDVAMFKVWLRAQSAMEYSPSPTEAAAGSATAQTSALLALFGAVDDYAVGGGDAADASNPNDTSAGTAVNDPFGYLNNDDDDDDEDIFALLTSMDKKVPAAASASPAQPASRESMLAQPVKQASFKQPVSPQHQQTSKSGSEYRRDPWENWSNMNASLQTWAGVTTNSKGNVQSLALCRSNLAGSIPSELGACDQLVFLDLNHNRLTGGLEPALSGCISLRVLCLQGNYLDGDVWTVLCKLTELEVINLNDNQLSQSIPNGIKQLTKLRELRARNNIITGKHLVKLPFHRCVIEQFYQVCCQVQYLDYHRLKPLMCPTISSVATVRLPEGSCRLL